MKKTISIGLLFVVLLSTIGVNVNKHYCHGTLMTTSVYHHDNSCGDMPMPEDCCKDETVVFEIEDEFNFTFIAFDVRPELSGEIEMPLIIEESIDKGSSLFFLDKESPPYEAPPIYLLDESFLI